MSGPRMRRSEQPRGGQHVVGVHGHPRVTGQLPAALDVGARATGEDPGGHARPPGSEHATRPDQQVDLAQVLAGALHDPATKSVTIGSGGQTKTGSLASVMLYADKMECSSCHDVHNTFTADGGDMLVKVTQTGSAICLACHDK